MIRMVLQRGDSNGFATRRFEWFCHAEIRMVLPRGDSNGFATRRFEWFCYAEIRMVLLRGDSNGFATRRFEWFCNVDRMVLQRGSNGLAALIKWFCLTACYGHIINAVSCKILIYGMHLEVYCKTRQ